jgi:hypothetical protein
LIEHARAAFRLAQTDKDGISLAEHYRQVERATGRRPPELDLPDIPPMLAPFWEDFLRIHATRTADEPIAFSEVLAYSRLTGTDFEPNEVDLISDLDRVWREERRANG